MKFALIIPTYKERENLEWLLPAVCEIFKTYALDGEILVVDDNSPDGSESFLKKFSQNHPVRFLIRRDKRGLSSAVLDGFKATDAEILGVMDADGSHPQTAIPAMLKALSDPHTLMVVGSRFVAGGGCQGWPWRRYFISWVARQLARPLFRTKDLTSGFFFFKRSAISDLATMEVLGFKIGLAILAKIPNKKVQEVPIVFTDRRFGSSKLGNQQIVEYLKQLAVIYRERILSFPRRRESPVQ